MGAEGQLRLDSGTHGQDHRRQGHALYLPKQPLRTLFPHCHPRLQTASVETEDALMSSHVATPWVMGYVMAMRTVVALPHGL
jgi:hypothetical protein